MSSLRFRKHCPIPLVSSDNWAIELWEAEDALLKDLDLKLSSGPGKRLSEQALSSQLLALEFDRCLKDEVITLGVTESWYEVRGLRLGLELFSSRPRALAASARFFILSLDSPYVALLLALVTAGLAWSGLTVHHEDLPASSLGTLTNLWCSERLWRIEF